MSMAPTLADVIALDEQPVLRNLLITQAYHALSEGLARCLGRDNANWCHFATRASKTAGRFIRRDEVPRLFRSLLQDSPGISQKGNRLVGAVRASNAASTLEHAHVLSLVEAVVSEVSQEVVAGNLEVFSELGPVFTSLIGCFGEQRSVDQERFDALLESLRPGATADGGQSLLRAALEHFVDAHRESNPRRRAQCMLLANAQTGLHEQIRLQPFIARSIDAPIDEVFHRLRAREALLAGNSRVLAAIHAVFDRLTMGLEADMRQAWEVISTRELMTLLMPGETLRLGAALPPPKGRPLFPEALEILDHPDLLDLAHQLEAFENVRRVASVRDWARLDERMRYIILLFRSRQQEASLFTPPFEELQITAIFAGMVPDGEL
jgi:hypothetical protein